MTVLSGEYFDGTSSRPTPVTLTLLPPDRLRLSSASWQREQPLTTLRLEQRAGQAPALLHAPDGSVVEVWDDGSLARWMGSQRWGRWRRLLAQAESRPSAALAVIGLAIGAVTLALVQGLPALSGLGARAVPEAWERSLGEQVLAELDGPLLQPSRLSAQRQRQLQQLMADLRPQLPVPIQRLELRAADQIGANAMALPGGILVLTDPMVEAASADELRGVLAHEAGHVLHRHGLQSLLRQQSLNWMLLMAIGRPSNLQLLSESLVTTAYSREFEREADREAVTVLRRLGIPPQRLFDLLHRLETAKGGRRPGWLESHPNSTERRRSALGPGS